MGLLGGLLSSQRRGRGADGVTLGFSNGEEVECRVASRFLERLRGLIRSDPASREARGLLLVPCSSVHTFGMSFPLDLVFLDRCGGVVRVCRDVPPGRVVPCVGAHAVLEMRAREGPGPLDGRFPSGGLAPDGGTVCVTRIDLRMRKDGEKEKAGEGPDAA